jgi:ABC-type uncharacterized transport system permease subunit
MSMAIGHFAAGAGCAFLVLNVLPPQIRRKVPDYGFIGIFAGLLAMVPDLARFTPRLLGFHNSVFTNIFFLHPVMDRLDINDSAWVSGGLVGFMVVFMLTLWANDFWRRKADK